EKEEHLIRALAPAAQAQWRKRRRASPQENAPREEAYEKGSQEVVPRSRSRGLGGGEAHEVLADEEDAPEAGIRALDSHEPWRGHRQEHDRRRREQRLAHP